MWGEKKVIIGLFSIFALAGFAVAGDTGTPVLEQGAPSGSAMILVAEPMWLDLDILQGHIDPKKIGNDNFVMKGSFNLEPGTLDPATSDVTLRVDEWELTIPGADWHKKGKTNKYMAKASNVTAQIEYWVKGSSRCKFAFIGVKQDLQSSSPNYPNLEVELQVGTVFDESLTAVMVDRGTAFKMGPDAVESTFIVKSLHVVKNKKSAGHDSFVLVTRVIVEEEFDPATNDVDIEVGNYLVHVPAGTLVIPTDAKGFSYRATLPDGGKLRLSVIFETGKMTVGVTNVDLGVFGSPTTVRFRMSAIPEANWARQLWLVTNPGQTSYKY